MKVFAIIIWLIIDFTIEYFAFRLWSKRFGLRSLKNIFNLGNVFVTGLRGRGKDLIFGNVISRKKAPYISNLDYGGDFIKLDLETLDVKNGFRDFIRGTVKKYVYPYDDYCDVYISDAGVYFPSTEFKALDREYPGLTTYAALCRQLGNNNIHVNVQNIDRCWINLREQSDLFILCNRCVYLKKLHLVYHRITIYAKYESAAARVQPFPKPRLFSKMPREQYEAMRLSYEATHGKITRKNYFYFNTSKHDTRFFKSLLEGGVDFAF